MGAWRWLRRRWDVLFRKRGVEAELDEEIRTHLDEEIRQNVQAGMSPAEARRRALVAFGGVERHKEEVRNVRGVRVLDDLVQDVRVSFRSFLKAPAFLVAVLLTLGLGIGANVAMFGILDASLFRPLPYPRADRLVMGRVTWNGRVGRTVSGPDFFDYRQQSSSFEDLAAYTPFVLRATVTGGGAPERVRYIYASTRFFRALGVEPVLGRGFAPDEGELGGPRVLILSYGFWQRRFGGDRDILGRSVTIAGIPFTVVGVMPRDFRFAVDVDIWVPLQRGGAWAQARQFHNFILVGRLADGVSVKQAQADVDRISESLAETYPETNRNKGLNLTPLKEALAQPYKATLGVLVAAVAVLLLIACGNVAGLLLARGSARRSELAVRSVMGAGRSRLARQLLTENVLLALGAGVVGIALATWLQRGILAFVSMDRLTPVKAGVSLPMLGFALALSVLTVVIFGALPSLRVARVEPGADLQSGTRTTGGRAATRARNVLVTGQVALTVVLLVVSGLLLRTLRELRGVDLGFDPDHLLTAAVQIPSTKYPTSASRVEFFRELQERVAALPGVEGVGFITRLPVRGSGGNVRVDLPEHFGTAGVFGKMADQRTVMPGYFHAMGIPLVAGRDVSLVDDSAATPVVVISKALAESLFPGEDALGRTVGVDVGEAEPARFEVVGVVGDVVMDHPANGPYPAMYFPYPQAAGTGLDIAVRYSGNAGAATTSVRGVLRTLNTDVPLDEPATMHDVLGRSLSGQQAIAVVVSLFGVVALLLAAIGMYGVLAFQVSRRTHEIGIRMALGASGGAVVSSVVRGGLILVALGLAVGIPASLFAARLVGGLLFGVGATDPVTYVGVALFLGAVATVACMLPAYRAARTDPVVAFRTE
ncbi:MAG: ABC transporter permease [Gemmatimonadetes bacterium]|nr:ABC transporter permease [Gemmatimonadota bacterium]